MLPLAAGIYSADSNANPLKIGVWVLAFSLQLRFASDLLMLDPS